MRIHIYGGGCDKCHTTTDLVNRVLAQHGIDAEVIRVTDMREIITAGVLATPAVAIDGVIKSTGRVPLEEQIAAWLVTG